MDETGLLPADLTFSSLQDPGERYAIGSLLGSGVYAEVFEATDQQAGKSKYCSHSTRFGRKLSLNGV
jgi:hypothetical protein